MAVTTEDRASPLEPPTAAKSTRWFQTGRFRTVAIAAMALAAAVEAVYAVWFRENDFAWHVNLGRTFLAGEIYRDGVGDWYLPGRILLDALPALLPYRAARGVVYVLALAGLTGSLILWHRLDQPRLPATRANAFAAAVFTLALLYPYVVRDLDDCGLQILLLTILTAAAYAVSRGWSAQAGGWLGLAITYKTTPLLFLPLLLWKRRWSAAFWMAVFVVLLNLLPALFVGWEKTLRAARQWVERARLSLRIEDPSQNAVEPPRHQNQSLTMAIARYVQTYPPGHPLHLDHPLFYQFGSLEPAAARAVVTAIVLALAGALAWRMRRPWGNAETAANLAPEWAAACVLVALLSPLTWLQHLVLVLPSIFLTIRAWLQVGSLARWRAAALWTIGVIVLLLQRDVVQRDLSLVVLSYKLDTLVALLAMLLVLIGYPTRRHSALAPVPAR